MNWIYKISNAAPFIVATTEAPSYRRVALLRMREQGLTGEQIKGSGFRQRFCRATLALPATIGGLAHGYVSIGW